MDWSSSTPTPTPTTRFTARGGPGARADATAQSLSTASAAAKKKKQGGGPRLNDVARLEIIALLNAPNRLSLRKIGARYDVCEATVRHVRDSADAITSRALAVPEDVRKTTLRVAQKTFPELEELLAQWLDSSVHGRLGTNNSSSTGTDGSDSNSSAAKSSSSGAPEPGAVMRKAEELAAQLGIREHEFKASKSWLKNFQRRMAAKAVMRARIQAEAAAKALVPSPPAVQSTDVAAADTTTATPAAEKKKRKRGSGPRLSDGQRLEIILKLEDASAPASNRKLAEEYNVDEATIRHVKTNAEALRARALNAPVDVRQTTFRASKTKFAELEAILAEWIDVSRRCSEEIPPPVVRRKAEEVARELEIPAGDFRATKSWYASFCRRQGLGPVAPIANLAEIVAEYDPSDVFTVDETGLFYRLLPRHAQLIPGAASQSASERARTMDRVTLLLCCNATGSERLPASMISKARWPSPSPASRSHSSQSKSGRPAWPLPHFYQSKAWMDARVFSNWFDQVFEPFVLSRSSSKRESKVLLLLDNAPGHPVGFEKSGIRVLAVHPQSASWTPPLELGVLTALKNRYKRRMLHDILAFHALPVDVKSQVVAGANLVRQQQEQNGGEDRATDNGGLFFGQAPHLLDAARLVADAWREISPELLQCAFREANFIAPVKSERNASSQATAIRIEEEEFKLEEDIFKTLRGFLHQHQSPHQSQQDITMLDGAGVDSDAALAKELQTFLHLDDESSQVFRKCILDDIDAAAVSGGAIESTGEPESEPRGSAALSADGERGEPSAGTSANAMDRILNGASAVSASDALATATLLGLQLRQLAASSAFDTQEIDDAVLALDRVRHKLQDASFSGSNAVAHPVSTVSELDQQAVSQPASATSLAAARQKVATRVAL